MTTLTLKTLTTLNLTRGEITGENYRGESPGKLAREFTGGITGGNNLLQVTSTWIGRTDMSLHAQRVAN